MWPLFSLCKEISGFNYLSELAFMLFAIFVLNEEVPTASETCLCKTVSDGNMIGSVLSRTSVFLPADVVPVPGTTFILRF